MIAIISSYLIEASVCIGLVWLLYYSLFRKSTQVVLRRAVILIGLAISLLFPLVEIEYEVSGSVLTTLSDIRQYVNSSINSQLLPEAIVSANGSSNKDSFSIINWIYFTGMFSVMSMILFQLVKIARLVRNSEKVKLNSYYIIYSQEYPSFSFFNFIVLNSNDIINSEEKRSILSHEIYHIKDLHSIDNVFVSVIKSLFWFHPAVWYFSKEIKMVHEYLADEHVANQLERASYCELLSRMTLRTNNLTLGNSFNSSQTINRLKMMNTQKQPISHWKIGTTFLVFTLMFVGFACTENNTTDSVLEPVVEEPVVIGEDATIDLVAKPKNGMEDLYTQLVKELKYPEQAKELGIEGRVFIEFMVSEEGIVSDAQLVKGIGAGCDQAALNAFNKVDIEWNPATKDGVPVSMKMTLPVSFALN